MQKKAAKHSKFSKWVTAINGDKPTPPVAVNELQLTLRTHAASQSTAQILISPDINLGVQVGDIIAIYIDQPSDCMLAEVSAQTLQQNPISRNQISILRNITDLYPINFDDKGIRFKAKVKKLSQTNSSNHSIQFVEVLLKGQSISEYDRYRIAKQLINRTIYPLKILEFQKIRVQIFSLLSSGDIPKMGVLTKNTKVIYRSGSSTHTILIQFTKDMFDLDYYQQLYVQRVVQLFKVYNIRNNLFQVNHNFEIVFFARLFYPQFTTLNQAYDYMVGKVQKIHSEDSSKINSINLAVAFQKDTKDRIYQDCYRKVIWCQHYGSLTAFMWKKIGQFLYTINWKQNVKPLASRILQRVESQMGKTGDTTTSSVYGLGNPELKIRPFLHFLQCELADSQICNVLQAIILAAQQQGKHYYGANLSTTGNAITVLSAGHSKYYTDPATLRLAKSTVYLTNISCMLINLRQKKPQLQIIQIMVPPNLVQENSDSKMNLLVYGCLDALIYSSPLYSQQYQHPHCFQNRMAIKLSHLRQITKQNQTKYFKNIKLEKLKCGHEVHFVLNEDMDCSSTTSYQQRVKNPQWIDYSYFGKKSMQLHHKYYEIQDGLDPAKAYLYGEPALQIEVLPIFRHADQQLFEVTSLKTNNNRTNKPNQKYHCHSNFQDLGLQLPNLDNQIAMFQNQVCPKMYLSKVMNPIKKKHDSATMLSSLAKAVFHQEQENLQRKDRIQSDIKINKKSSKQIKRLAMNKTSSIFRNDKFSIAELGPWMYFTNFARTVASQFNLRVKHNFVDLQIHYLMPWFSTDTLRNLKATIFRDNKTEMNKIHRQFDMQWNWKSLCFPLLSPLTTVADIQALRVIPRQNITSTNAADIKLLVGQKLNQGFQLVEDPEKISGSFQINNQFYHLMKGHLYYPIELLGESNLIIKQCQVIDKNSQISRKFPNSQDLIKALEHRYSDMLYRYLCYEQKQFRFVPKRTYFKNDNSWHKIKHYNQNSIKLCLVIDTTTEQTPNRQKYKISCNDSFKQFINALNQKYKNTIPDFCIKLSQGQSKQIPTINRIPIKLGCLNSHLEIFKNDSFYLNYESSWNSKCTYNITLSWNGCLGIYINEFLNTLLSMAKFGKKIIPYFVPSEPCIFETEWKFESPAEIVFSNQISMDLMQNSMQQGWVWDRNGFYFKKDGFSFVKFYKQRKLLLWKDNYKQIVDARQIPENQFFNFFVKSCAYDFVGEIIQKIFSN